MLEGYAAAKNYAQTSQFLIFLVFSFPSYLKRFLGGTAFIKALKLM